MVRTLSIGISTGNILQPTGSLYDFHWTSYDPLCIFFKFYKSGDLDLAFYQIFKKKLLQGPRTGIHRLSNKSGRSDQRCGLYIAKGQTNKETRKQTSKQTNRGDQYTLRKSEISQSNIHLNPQLTPFTDRILGGSWSYMILHLHMCIMHHNLLFIQGTFVSAMALSKHNLYSSNYYFYLCCS